LTFFLVYLFISIVCEYLKNYSLESCRFHLRKLIFVRSQQNPKKVKECQKEILNNFFAEAELFTPIFISVPQKIFSAVVSVVFSFFFMADMRKGNDSNFITYFVLIISLILVALIFFSYRIQSKINQKESKFRRQENSLFEEYLQKQRNPRNLEKVIDKNFQQIRYSF
jgi:ABC-type multidrug transport system fused ATPase/permease subunit